MKFKFYIPIILFVLLVVLLYKGLSLDPKEVPSPLINKDAPAFVAPMLYEPEQSVSVADFKGEVWILNVFASWCVSCRAEHAVVTRYANSGGVAVVGLNYKDEPQDAKRWLAQFGDPYSVIVTDYKGQIGLDWGVYGVPESFVVDKKGKIRYKQIGPITNKALDEKIIPLIKILKGEKA